MFVCFSTGFQSPGAEGFLFQNNHLYGRALQSSKIWQFDLGLSLAKKTLSGIISGQSNMMFHNCCAELNKQSGIWTTFLRFLSYNGPGCFHIGVFMSCWVENPADKEMLPAPSHFLFSYFGWGSLWGCAGAELCSWHFLGCMSLQREIKRE